MDAPAVIEDGAEEPDFEAGGSRIGAGEVHDVCGGVGMGGCVERPDVGEG